MDNCKHCGHSKMFEIKHLDLKLCLICGKADKKIKKKGRLPPSNMNPDKEKIWP